MGCPLPAGRNRLRAIARERTLPATSKEVLDHAARPRAHGLCKVLTILPRFQFLSAAYIDRALRRNLQHVYETSDALPRIIVCARLPRIPAATEVRSVPELSDALLPTTLKLIVPISLMLIRIG